MIVLCAGFSGISSTVNPFTAAPQTLSVPSAVTQNGTAGTHATSSSITSVTVASTSATVSSLANQDRVFRPKSIRYYNIQIKNLSELIPDSPTRVGVCGVVKYFKAPSASKGKDCYTVIGIVDETSPQKSLECVVFNPHQGRLPVVCSVGGVVLIKGITIRNFNNVLTGTGHEHTLVGIFSSTPLSNSIGTWYELRSNELSRIKSLKQWAIDQGHVCLNTKFEEVTSLHYFNTVCRIASIATDDQLGIQALSVYDGTTLKLPSSEISQSSSKHQWKMDNDPNACYMYQGLINDVFVSEIKNIKVGDTVELVNVLSLPVTPNTADADPNSQPQIELKIMNRIMYKGNVRVLPGDSPSVQQFLNDMPRPYGPFPVQRSPSNVPTTIGTVLHKQLKQTATLKQIQDAPIGSVFCCEVEVVGAGPAPIEDFCQLRCSDCKLRYAIPKLEDMESEDSGFLTVGDPCIYCSDSEESTSTLKYMYLFTLYIRDITGELRVFVSDKEGATLLQNLPPNNLHVDNNSRQKLLDVLYSLTGGNDPFFPLPCDPKFSYPRPLLNCCILTYMSQTEQQRYSLVDTVLSN